MNTVNQVKHVLACGARIHKADPTARHRGRPFDKYVSNTARLGTIDRIDVTVIYIDGAWFVVANLEKDEPKFPDLGPFPTPELALMCIRLGKD